MGALFAIELSSTAVWRELERFRVHLGKVREMMCGDMGIKKESDQLVRRSEAQKRFEQFALGEARKWKPRIQWRVLELLPL